MTDPQVADLMAVLREIRDELRTLTTPEDEVVVVGCPHPEDARVSLATPGDPDHWVCHHCRYEHRLAN